MTTGTVRSFDVHKGYGLIKPDDGGVDVLVDICAVERAEMNSLKQGQRLSFEIVYNERIGISYAQNLIASEIRTPPLNAFSPIAPLHGLRAIQRPQAPTVKMQERIQRAIEPLDTAISKSDMTLGSYCARHAIQRPQAPTVKI